MLATTAGLLLLSAATLTSGGDPREVRLTSGGDPGEVAVFRPPPDELDRLLDVSLLDDIEAQLERDAQTGGNSTALLSRSRRALAFPTGSYAQVDFQLYMPFYTQGDFSAILDWTTRFRLFLPNSTSGISLGRRSLDEDREKIYGIIEAMMYSFGVDGHICLLRTICDVAEQPFQDDGVLGDVLNTVMAASYRWQDDKMYEYVEAEYYGRYYGNCQEAYDCPVSMSRIVDVMTDVVG